MATICRQLKMKTIDEKMKSVHFNCKKISYSWSKKKSDGKKWETAVSGIQCVFGIIQFVSSTKEEFKIRLAEV